MTTAKRTPQRAALLSTLFWTVAGCIAGSDQRHEPPPWAAPTLERATSIRDGANGDELTIDELMAAISNIDVVFLGETHLDETTHRVELRIMEELIERTGGKTILALEMFERDAQPLLDSYIAGEIEESEFLAKSRPWGNYQTAYRPLLLRARTAGIPVIASNVSRSVRRKIAMGGQDAFESLTPEERSLVASTLYESTGDYWRRVDNATRGHLHGMGGDPSQRIYSTQSLWDNTMAESCALALDRFPGYRVLHVNGGFHSAHRDGTVRQLKLRRPELNIVTVALEPSAHPSVAEPDLTHPVADYVIFCETRARDRDGDEYAVTVPTELKYRLHLPPSASESNRAPLLIWLGDDGSGASEGMDLWKNRIGDRVAIASVEAPRLTRQDDLVEGGQWFRNNTSMEDLLLLEIGVNRIFSYLARNLPIQRDGFVIAGEGTGGSVVAVIAEHAGEMPVQGIAIDPTPTDVVTEIPLPLDSGEKASGNTEPVLTVLHDGDDSEVWERERDAASQAGITIRNIQLSENPWECEIQTREAIYNALGLSLSGRTSKRLRVEIPTDTPRARRWARLIAAANDRDGIAAIFPHDPSALVNNPARAIDISIRASNFASDTPLPRAPGAFGGTTILVIPADTPEAEAKEWETLVENDPLQADSRFHRLRVARQGGEPGLCTVLDQLREQKRLNVLVVPTVFCAGANEMRELARELETCGKGMTVHWLPGLGQQLGKGDS